MGKKRVIKETDGEMREGAKMSADVSVESSPEAKASTKKRKKTSKITKLPSARIYIAASYNNTLISLTDAQGNLLLWSSAGLLGFKGPKKATPYAASKVIEDIFGRLGNAEVGRISVFVRGIGGGRDAALRALATRGIDISLLEDTTPIPHNGCRPRKARRV